MNTQKMQFRHDQGYLTSKDGIQLFYQCWIPDVSTHTMVFVHGLGEHSGRYGNPVSYFCPRGYAVYAMDNRGHGRSSGIRGHIDASSQYVDDLAHFIDKVREESGKDALFLVGHSLGGLISLSYALAFQQGLSGVIISSPGLRTGKAPPAIKAFMGRILSRVWPTLTLSNEIDPTHISRDKEVVNKYISDPLVHNRVSTRFYTEFLKETARVMTHAPSMQVPFLLMQAGRDLLVDPQASKEFFERAGSKDKTLMIYEQCYHELFNEPEKEKVFADMEQWIQGRLH